MDDTQIMDLYWSRNESAVSETAAKYGGYCYSIAYNILTNNEDAEESVNDTYLAAWNAMPPRRPKLLSTFLGKITRNLSLDRWRSRRRDKRGGGELPLALEELGECASGECLEDVYARKELARCLNRFVAALPEPERSVFVCRYWYVDSLKEVAARFGFTEAKTATMLLRTRKKLHAEFEKEGLL
ncbi:MAG: sigma-70 family RNA polymerase sigma factor [Eubacteriales bacterium]|nr:sigma-70 family RNA polymerase sigma factor [Eubacteriales bacterium]